MSVYTVRKRTEGKPGLAWIQLNISHAQVVDSHITPGSDRMIDNGDGGQGAVHLRSGRLEWFPLN